jgi:hypothetical protein
MAKYAFREKDLERKAKFIRKFDEYVSRLVSLD